MFFEVWRGFDVPPAGYKLYNEVKPVVNQSFLHNLNLRISQVISSGNSFVPIHPPPSPILPFVTTDASTAIHYFGCQGNRQ